MVKIVVMDKGNGYWYTSSKSNNCHTYQIDLNITPIALNTGCLYPRLFPTLTQEHPDPLGLYLKIRIMLEGQEGGERLKMGNC